MKVRVLHPTIIDSQWLKVDDVADIEIETAQPYVELGLIEAVDEETIIQSNNNNDGDENPPDDETNDDGGKDSKSGKGK